MMQLTAIDSALRLHEEVLIWRQYEGIFEQVTLLSMTNDMLAI